MKKLRKRTVNYLQYLKLAVPIFFLVTLSATAALSQKAVSITMNGKFCIIPIVEIDEGCVDPTIPSPYPGAIHAVPSAYPTIQAAIDGANTGDTVLVDNGTYTANIILKGSSSKTVYIFSKNGPDLTTIQGSGNGAAVTFSQYNKSLLSGFTITGGQGPLDGGGIIVGTGATPTIHNCIITNNKAILGGGGIHVASSAAPFIKRCIIKNNQTTGGTKKSNGGGVHVAGSATATISNSTITGNTSSYNGGAIASKTATVKIINSTISGNIASFRGGGISLNSPNAGSFITNSILWGNADARGSNQIQLSDQTYLSGVTYSDIQGSYPGAHNISQDPNFIGGGNYHLQSNSPCIDRGTNANAPNIDIDGHCRPEREGFDIGSDEVLEQE